MDATTTAIQGGKRGIDMVAIKDMEMPRNCAECILFHFYFDLDGVMHYVCKCGNMEMCGYLENKRNDFCPLIEVDKESEE